MGITSVSDYAWGHLPQHAMGTVHSVFSSSLNVELDGLLLHLGSSDAPLSCLGANVDAEEMPALVGSAVQGDRAVFRDGVLRIYSRARVSELELSAAPVRCMRVPELAGAFPNDIDAPCCARSVPRPCRPHRAAVAGSVAKRRVRACSVLGHVSSCA